MIVDELTDEEIEAFLKWLFGPVVHSEGGRAGRMTRKAHLPITPARLAELRAMPYADYLHTPEWTRRRAVQLMLAEHRCQLCNGTEGGLQVHHRSYGCIGQERRADLIVLCRDCHTIFHQHRRLVKPRMAG